MISSNYEYWKSYLIPLVIYFLSSVLIKFRLGKIFITSIETLLKDQLLWIINGGTNTQYFNVETGARKGDRINAYPLILTLDILFLLFKKKSRN